MRAILRKHAPYFFEGGFPKDRVIQGMKELDLKIIHPDAMDVDETMMTLAKEQSWQVFPWFSIKDESAKEVLWERLYNLGIDGLCTNYPRELSEWLSKKAVKKVDKVVLKEKGHLKTTDGMLIHYRIYGPRKPTHYLLVANGRSEWTAKYEDLHERLGIKAMCADYVGSPRSGRI